MLDTDASNFGLGGVLSQIQNGIECVIAYCSRALRLRSGSTALRRERCGGGVNVYTVLLILAGSKVYFAYGSQVVGVVAPI